MLELVPGGSIRARERGEEEKKKRFAPGHRGHSSFVGRITCPPNFFQAAGLFLPQSPPERESLPRRQAASKELQCFACAIDLAIAVLLF